MDPPNIIDTSSKIYYFYPEFENYQRFILSSSLNYNLYVFFDLEKNNREE